DRDPHRALRDHRCRRDQSASVPLRAAASLARVALPSGDADLSLAWAAGTAAGPYQVEDHLRRTARLRPVRTRRRERSRPRRTTLRAGASRDPRHARAWPGRAQRRVAGLNADGVLVVDKPVGPTSHDIVAQARRWYGTRSVGHAGTLDPAASGVLVLMFGEAKKLS